MTDIAAAIRWGIAALLAALLVALLVAIVAAPLAAAAIDTASGAAPDNSGPLKLVSCSWLGGDFDDELVSANVGADGDLILAGNAVTFEPAGVARTLLGEPGTLQPAPPEPAKGKAKRHPSTFGFIVRVAKDGQKILGFTRFGYGIATISKLRLDAKGNLYVLGDAPGGLEGHGSGSFIAGLDPTATKLQFTLFQTGISDFAIDGDGDLVVLAGAQLTRYAADGRTIKWTTGWKCYGDNRPGGLTVSPEIGIAVVCGYGMTKTGHEPYKDPYAYGFDRSGKQVWALWNPDPTREVDAKYGGNGLMADSSGLFAAVAGPGKVYVAMKADGGNTVLARDPADPAQKLDPEIFAGVHQATAGFGFHGASMSSVIFRLDAASGKPEKGTFMTAWLDPAHANGLKMDAAVGDAAGTTYLVGGSAQKCPVKAPWYVAAEGCYQGGGFLAILDKDFKLRQCGYFPGASITCVGQRQGTVVIAGSAVAKVVIGDRTKPDAAEATGLVPSFRAVQRTFGGGNRDGFFAVFTSE